MMKKYALLSSAAMLLLSTSLGHAAEPMSMESMQKQIEMLAKQVEKLSTVVEQQGQIINSQHQQIAAQKADIKEQADKTAALKMATVAPAAGGDAPPDVKITMNPSPKIESADGKYSFQPFGRVHLDTTVFSDDQSDLPDNMHFRRARLGFKGNLGEDFNYKAEFDFAGEVTNFKEVYLSYTGLKPVELVLGNLKPPVGFEQNTSGNYMPLIENSPVTNALTRDEIIGLLARTGGDNWSLAGGVFNEDASVNNGTDDEGFSFDARGSVDLLQDNPDVLHIGLGGSIRKPNAVTSAVTVSAKPAGTGPNMVTTGAVANVDRSYVYGPELAGVFGPFSFQGEYFWNDLDVNNGSDASFDGWYAQAGWVVTGETRPYKGKTGNFDRLKPATPFSLKEKGWGAFELVTRYDVLDLNDAGAGVLGGEIKDWTLGGNWYLTDNIRMMLNFTSVNTDNNAVNADDDPEILNLRAQWDF